MRLYEEIGIEELMSMQYWKVDDLKPLSQTQLMDLFLTLPAPDLREMHGEYKGYLLDQGNFGIIKYHLLSLILYNQLLYGHWLAKAFEPQSDTHGHGYNAFMHLGRVRYNLPMQTRICASRYDGRESFELNYSPYLTILGMTNTVDEIRKINETLYLGMATWGYTQKQRMIPYPFALYGPLRPYVEFDTNLAD